MKHLIKIVAIAVGVAFTGCEKPIVKTEASVNADAARIEELEAKVKAMEEQKAADERLGQWAVNAMYLAGAQKKFSGMKILVLAQDVVEVANQIFELEAHKRAFVSILTMESGFDRFAQSPTGPKGIMQVARKSFHEAIKEYCGVSDLHDDDVWETKINLYAGACYYRKMIELANGDLDVANAMYNQGPNSEEVKKFIKYGSMDALEPLKYVTRFGRLEKMNAPEPIQGAKVLTELPKPSPASVTPK